MKIVFLVPYPIGHSPSQRFRFEQYFEKLNEKGIAFQCFSFWSLKGWGILYDKGKYFAKTIELIVGFIKRFLVLFKLSKTDFIFIHRECTPIGPPIFEWIIAKILGKKIIYDFDDAIWLPNTSNENKIVSIIKWHSKVKSICKWSYKVSCGNFYLTDYASQYNNNVVVNPTTIDTEKLHNPALYSVSKSNHKITIGWTGTHSTIKYLDSLVPVLRQLEKKHPVRFVVIANKPPQFQLSSLEFIYWKQETEIEDLLQFDVGVMPLTDDIWAKGKCGFKALQYMSLGIPTVASAVGVNSYIITDGSNGFLCSSDEQWYEALDKLLSNPTLREKIGKAGVEKIQNQFSVSSNSFNFLNLFS